MLSTFGREKKYPPPIPSDTPFTVFPNVNSNGIKMEKQGVLYVLKNSFLRIISMYGDNALMLLGGTPIAISLIPISALSEKFSLIRYPIDDENAIDDISFNLENR